MARERREPGLPMKSGKIYNNGLPRKASDRELQDPKQCTLCRDFKPRNEFNRIWKSRPAVQPWCKTCSAYKAAAYIRTNPQVRNYVGPNTCRIPVIHYERLLRAQNELCAICSTADPGRGNKRFCIDHCHKTGVVRGLLCHKCNSGLGRFEDDPKIMRRAVAYLENVLCPC